MRSQGDERRGGAREHVEELALLKTRGTTSYEKRGVRMRMGTYVMAVTLNR